MNVKQIECSRCGLLIAEDLCHPSYPATHMCDATKLIKEPQSQELRLEKRRFKSECYMVAIDNTWFLSKDDWTESPAFGKKYSKASLAAADARDEGRKHPERNIRVVKVKQSFTAEELS